MSEHRIDLIWHDQRGGIESADYTTSHAVQFDGDLDLKMDAAPEYGRDTNSANPEQALASALSSCHMMRFPALAAKAKWSIRSYADHAVASLGRTPDRRMAVEFIELNPRVIPADNGDVSTEDLTRMHERAHRYCFVANAPDLEVKINAIRE